MISIAVAIRLIWGLSLAYTNAYNASWICPLIGLILFLPAGFAIKQLSAQSTGCAFHAGFLQGKSPAKYIAALCIIALLAFDASVNMHLLSNTADVMALGEAPVWLLALPLMLLIFVCAVLGMEAEGRSARIWMKIMLPMLAAVVIVQFRNYRVEWLAPVLGGGFKRIVNGGIYSAGCMALLSLPWLVCVEDTNHKSVLPYAFYGSVAASAVLALLAMLSPALVKTSLSRTAKIEMLLSNGRVHLMLQLLMVVLWFANLLHLMNAESTAAVAFIRIALPGISKWLVAALISACIFIGTVSGIAVKESFASVYRRLLFPLVCAILILLLICAIAYERRNKHENRV